MPYDDPDATDPMTLHGVVLETKDDAAMRDMAECFVEEYLRSGFDGDRILRMFKTQGYAGPFLAYQTLGEDAIRGIVDGLVLLWGERAPVSAAAAATKGTVSLPVLEQALFAGSVRSPVSPGPLRRNGATPDQATV